MHIVTDPCGGSHAILKWVKENGHCFLLEEFYFEITFVKGFPAVVWDN